jgi:hypothetical protein
VVRIAFACASFVNWCFLWPQRYQLLASDGMLPVETPSNLRPLSVFHHVEGHAAIDALMLIGLLGIVGVFTGVRLRLSILVTYLFTLGYSYQAIAETGSWDNILRIVSFVLLLSPLGDPYCWRRRPPKPASQTLPRYGLLVLKIQVSLIYFSTVWHKVADSNWRNGDLLQYFFLSVYRIGDGTWALKWPLLLASLTYLTLVIEMSVPLLLWNKRWRPLGFLLGWGLHLSIAATSNIGLFSLVMMSCYFVFLDGDDIDRLERIFARMKQVARFGPQAEAHQKPNGIRQSP